MSQFSDEVLPANQAHAGPFGRKVGLVVPPARHFAILTRTDAHVIRNAGGRVTDETVGSLVISHELLGTNEWCAVHHMNCGMELFSDEVIGDLLEHALDTASLDGTTSSNPKHEGSCSTGPSQKRHTITDGTASVIQDVRRIHEHPLAPEAIPIRGYIYDARAGWPNAVDAATVGGAAR